MKAVRYQEDDKQGSIVLEGEIPPTCRTKPTKCAPLCSKLWLKPATN
jgi:hypothetical protein